MDNAYDHAKDLARDMRLLREIQERLMEIKPVMSSTSLTGEKAVGVLADTWNTLICLRDSVLRLVFRNPVMAFAGGADAIQRVLLEPQA
jgi:hypothetical protein